MKIRGTGETLTSSEDWSARPGGGVYTYFPLSRGGGKGVSIVRLHISNKNSTEWGNRVPSRDGTYRLG